MKYVYVDEGSVVQGPQELPSTWNNISGFNTLSQDKLRRYGWLPVQYTNDTYDSTVYTQTGPTITVYERYVHYEYGLELIPRIYAHVTLTPQNVIIDEAYPSMKRDNTDYIDVHAVLRATDESDSQILTFVNNKTWNIKLKELELENGVPIFTGRIYQIFRVTFQNGEVTFRYKTDQRTCLIGLDDNDFDSILNPGDGLTYSVVYPLGQQIIFEVYDENIEVL